MSAHAQVESDVFTLLSNERRRGVVRAFSELEPPIDVGDLAEYIAADENDKTIPELTSEERRRVYTALQQRHLDKLEEAGIIERDRDRIEPTDRIEELEMHLEVVGDREIPWAEFYLGLSAVAAGVTAAAYAGVYPEAVPAFGWTALVVGAFAVSSAVHVYKREQRKFDVSDLVGDSQ